jgi:hypothetical protein
VAYFKLFQTLNGGVEKHRLEESSDIRPASPRLPLRAMDTPKAMLQNHAAPYVPTPTRKEPCTHKEQSPLCSGNTSTIVVAGRYAGGCWPMAGQRGVGHCLGSSWLSEDRFEWQ